VHLKSDGTLSLLKSDGFPVGISLGRSLSDHKKTAVLASGLKVPIRVSLKPARATVTISSYANLVSGTDDSLKVGATTFTAQAGASTPGAATFTAATANSNTATSLAAQINAHAVASLVVRAKATSAAVLIYSIAGGEAGNEIDLVYTDNDTNVGITIAGAVDDKLAGGSDDIADIVAALGGAVYMSDSLGYAMENLDLSTVTQATYDSAPLYGVDEDGAEVPAIYVSMPGGL
jgi:hypothetical protein